MEKSDLVQASLGLLGLLLTFLVGGVLTAVGYSQGIVEKVVGAGLLISVGLTLQPLFFLVTNPIDDTFQAIREFWWDLRGKPYDK